MVSIGSDNGLVPNSRRDTSLPKLRQIHWRTYVSPGLNVLNRLSGLICKIESDDSFISFAWKLQFHH